MSSTRVRQTWRHLAALVGAVVVSSLAHARLGETEADIVRRFGKPQSRSEESAFAEGLRIKLGPRLVFDSDGWRITSVLTEGRVSLQSYSKPGKWTEEQIQAILAANSQGAKWTEITKRPGSLARRWKRADGATAGWSAVGIELIHPAYERAKQIEAAKAKAASGRLPKI